MAAGKTTTGRKLASIFGCNFYDTDAIVVRDHGPIPKIFSSEGEAAFRAYESTAVEHTLSQESPSVVALGGGALTNEANRTRVEVCAYSVFLKASPERIFARVQSGDRRRPLLGPQPALEDIRRLYATRLTQYERADHIVDVERLSDRAIVENVLAWLHERQIAFPLSAETNDDLGYPIVVANDAKPSIRALLGRQGVPAVVLCDANRAVRKLASDLFGKKPRIVGFTLGEARKRLTTVERVLDAMLEAGVQRDDLVIGVGGGVAADLFGFSAATYMRGVRYAHVATTLLAMVDAAIGGKNGVNLRGGKNLAGCFRDPVGVVCPLQALETLPEPGYRQGLAEIVKAAIIEGGDYFERLETGGASVALVALERDYRRRHQSQNDGRCGRSFRIPARGQRSTWDTPSRMRSNGRQTTRSPTVRPFPWDCAQRACWR